MEITVLALAGVLQMVQFILMAVPVNLEMGTGKTLSPRDPSQMGKPLAEAVSPGTGRLIRALSNHYEALILFAIACVTVTLLDKSTAATEMAAWLYLLARVLYVPAYYFGWVPWRSVFFGVGFFATAFILVVVVV